MTDGERVCFTEYDHLVCLDGADGGEVLDVDLPGPATPPALAGDTLVVAVDDDNVYGYSLDGDLLNCSPGCRKPSRTSEPRSAHPRSVSWSN